jgi:hypothetical protein
MKHLPKFFLVVDFGFVVYWLITLTQLIPDEFLFKDYNNPILMHWNWSFLPLDLAISATGFLSLYLLKTNRAWKQVALISLVLTFSSGLQAISFWTLANDFDIWWWLPNLYLLIYPLFFFKELVADR